MSYPELTMLIGGQWRSSVQKMAVINPADEEMIGEVPLANAGDLQDALTAAQAGLAYWRKKPPGERAQVMSQAANLLRERADLIAHVIVLEQGKTLAGARAEIERGCSILEWDANEGRRLYGRIIPSDSAIRNTAQREPVGIVAAFAPWNAPFSSPMRKISSALAAGCSLILKPAEETPAATWFIAQALQESGLPAGALNLVYGNPAKISATLIADPRVRMVTFTGSVSVGRSIALAAAQYLKPALLELGGHAGHYLS